MLLFLFKFIKSTLTQSNVPINWRVASEAYISKKKPPNPGLIEDFRPIDLLNVEGKSSFTLLSQSLDDHIIKKKILIDLSIHKGYIAKVSGCWELMSLVWKELNAAKTNKLNLAAVWLDISNVYGSVPHQLIFFTLERYGIDPI